MQWSARRLQGVLRPSMTANTSTLPTRARREKSSRWQDRFKAEAKTASYRAGTGMSGLYFEQLPQGFAIDHAIRRTVTEMDNTLFSALTHNPAALHLDAEY